MDAYGFLLTIISSGGALIVGIETFRDWLLRRREEYVELAKHKIETISKNIPYYIHLARNSWNLGWYGSTESKEQNPKRLLYYLANILYYKQKISEMIGDLQLDNLDA